MPRTTAIFVSLLLAACTDASDSTERANQAPDGSLVETNSAAATRPFKPYLPAKTGDPKTHRLCPGVDDAKVKADPIHIECALEGALLAPTDPPVPASLVVMTWNLERGHNLDGQIAALSTDPELPRADILLVSEADRGCARTSHRHVVAEIAAALSMNWVYAVEFVELPEAGSGKPACEHGNGILSRFALGNVEQIRHLANLSWHDRSDQGVISGRLGGRITVSADVRVGEQLLRVYSVHYSSSIPHVTRTAQAKETVAHSATIDSPVVIAGDLNVGLYFADIKKQPATLDQPNDPTVRVLVDAGFADAHRGLSYEQRITHPPLLVLDLVMGRGAGFRDPGRCPPKRCGKLSDHLPIWAHMDWPKGL